MFLSLLSFERRAGLISLLPFVLLLSTACGEDSETDLSGDSDSSAGSGNDASTGGNDSGPPGTDGGDSSTLGTSGNSSTGDDASTGGKDSSTPGDAGANADSGPTNLPNPAGLGPAPVALGELTDLSAAGSYVLLAKTGITNVTGSAISGGHLGLSPAAASFITGFALKKDATGEFSTSVSVVPPAQIYASNYAVPTPTNLTTAVLDMERAYTDAAGRSDPDFLNLASGEIGGETLVPGLYKWGTGVTIPGDVTISGGANDVWIFQISKDLDLSTATHVLLSGDAQAKNIFWQVAGEVTLHANSHFEGIILSKTGITLQTEASMNGRALAQSLVALDNNAITAP